MMNYNSNIVSLFAAGNGRMRRQSSGSSFYSEEGRRGSGGNAAQLPVSVSRRRMEMIKEGALDAPGSGGRWWSYGGYDELLQISSPIFIANSMILCT